MLACLLFFSFTNAEQHYHNSSTETEIRVPPSESNHSQYEMSKSVAALRMVCFKSWELLGKPIDAMEVENSCNVSGNNLNKNLKLNFVLLFFLFVF